jgi:hypothetical protein
MDKITPFIIKYKEVERFFNYKTKAGNRGLPALS